MAKSHMIHVTLLLSVTIFTSTANAAYLPEREVQTNQLDTIEPRQQQHQSFEHEQKQLYTTQQQFAGKHNATASHHESYDKNDDVVTAVEGLSAEEWETAVDSDDVLASREAVHARKRRDLSDWLIAPNTRWCGRGNTANGTYNHLGGASMADKCCRKHDHCNVYIPAMSNRYELFNYRPYTLSHCQCDRRFRTCLKLANDEDAKTIGKLFFNMVQTHCFVLRNEKVCHKRAEDGTCEQEIVKQKGILKSNKKF